MMNGLKDKRYAPISVIIPCYRCAQKIERAVASVVAQTWQPREVILVDDASDDDTPKVLRALQGRYSDDWIKVILREQNSGPAVARNAGWEAATQPCLAFLDADDTWHPHKIEIQLQHMQAYPEIVITGHRWRWIRENKTPLAIPERFKIYPVTYRQLLVSNAFLTPTVMLRRSLAFRFDTNKRFSEDYLLWLIILARGYKGAFLDIELAYICKAPYGVGGLSGHLWAMEKGELDTYWKLHKAKLLPWSAFIGLSGLSLVKYLRRLIKTH